MDVSELEALNRGFCQGMSFELPKYGSMVSTVILFPYDCNLNQPRVRGPGPWNPVSALSLFIKDLILALPCFLPSS